MSIWIDQQISRNLTINGLIIQQKARNNLHTYKKKGEAGSAPINELSQIRAELQEILQAYKLKDIWNCDETALFWRLEPSKTIAHDPVLGKKCLK
ncbi:tigger transposable element-derived protein 6-like [Rhizophagus irregularis DAOM 181602=DAOM 197198]|nr:tigger transposable element-derived protein 6-like [Rhizophagus irregularis DAOM 181602=DAOM 197198]